MKTLQVSSFGSPTDSSPLLGGFAIAWPFAFSVNRVMIGRGKGHAVVHEYHHERPARSGR